MVEFGESLMDISRLYEVTLVIQDADDGYQRKTLALPAHINPDEFNMLIAAAFTAPADLGITAVQDEISDVVYPILALLENPSSFCGTQKAFKLLMTSSFFRDKKAKKDESAQQQLGSRPFWRAVFSEFMATMLFVVIGVGSVLSGGELDHSFTPARLLVVSTAFGYAIVFLAYSTANISGAHFNPAVTFALVITRKIGIVRGIFYTAAQVCGAVCGAFLVRAAIPQDAQSEVGATKITTGVEIPEAFLIEFVLTFILVWTVFATAVDPKQSNGQFAAFAIGLSVFLAHLFGVPFTGCGINPARSFGSALASGIFTDHWLYWVAPLCGAAGASLLYQFAFLWTGRFPCLCRKANKRMEERLSVVAHPERAIAQDAFRELSETPTEK